MKKIVFILVLSLLFVCAVCASDSPEALGLKMIDIPGQNFLMSQTEVTQKLYESVIGKNPSHFKGDNLPVECVNWYDAIKFCNKLSEKYGLIPAYKIDGNKVEWNEEANGFRLPTLEEWQYTAKGGQSYTYAGSDNLDDVGWYWDNSDNKTHPVGQKKANGYGLYDMLGNVWEWCWVSYNSNRCYCGGSWSSRDYYCKEGLMIWRNPGYMNNLLGFRVVQNK